MWNVFQFDSTLKSSWAHNITKLFHDGLLRKKKVVDDLQLLVKKFVGPKLSAPLEWGILKLKENCIYLRPNPMDHNQRVVCCDIP